LGGSGSASCPFSSRRRLSFRMRSHSLAQRFSSLPGLAAFCDDRVIERPSLHFPPARHHFDLSPSFRGPSRHRPGHHHRPLLPGGRSCRRSKRFSMNASSGRRLQINTPSTDADGRLPAA
jgi:hypothetical protein